MYGTIARFRAKPGTDTQLAQLTRAFETLRIPGFVREYVYRMDKDPQEYYMVVLFESREAYWSNAQSPEQDARFQRLLSLIEGEPQWHDGEIVAIA
jgi:quinol monooxygenase YgiN